MANSQVSSAAIKRATAADLDAVLALERRPGYEAFVGRSTRAEHEEMLASPRYVYLLGLGETGAPFAFAILRDPDDPHGNLYLKRVAVDEPGQGRGVRFLAAALDWAFASTTAHRFYLDCFVENFRAQRAYAKLGFTRDGVLREAYLGPDGRRRDLALLAITRPEWRTRTQERRSAAIGPSAP
jgi:RimJ/RimL family protein N-acetyltransferase